MPDDRNGVPPGPPAPFGRAQGANGAHANGVRPPQADLPTRPLPVDVADGPVDLVAVQADDALVNALGSGAAVAFGDRAADPDTRVPRDERLVAMLAAWRAEIEAEPIPELVDLDTAVAAVVAGMKADAVGTRRRRADRLRHLAPLAAAAAIIVATVSGVGVGSQNAVPGDVLWPIQKVVNPERAESVETKIVLEGRLQTVRAALSRGDTATAAAELDAIRTEIPAVRGEEGQPQLLQEQEFLAAKLAETPPGTPADLTTPPKNNPAALPTSVAVAPPPPPASVPTDPSQVAVVPDDPSVSQPADPDPRARVPSEALVVPAPESESGSEGPTTPGSGSSEPQVTRAPAETAPESTEGSPEESTAPEPSSDRPISEGDGEPPAGDTGTDTTASGSAGTSIEATATASTS